MAGPPGRPGLGYVGGGRAAPDKGARETCPPGRRWRRMRRGGGAWGCPRGGRGACGAGRGARRGGARRGARPGGEEAGRPEEGAGDRGWRAGQRAVRETRAAFRKGAAIWLNLPEEQANLED